MDKKEALEKAYSLERQFGDDLLSVPEDNPTLLEIHNWYKNETHGSYYAKNKYDWESIQSDFDQGLKKTAISNRNGISLSSLKNGIDHNLVDDTKWKKIRKKRQSIMAQLHKRERRELELMGRLKDYDWKKIQNELDKGTTKTDIGKMFSIHIQVLGMAIQKGLVSDETWQVITKRVRARKYYQKKHRE